MKYKLNCVSYSDWLVGCWFCDAMENGHLCKIIDRFLSIYHTHIIWHVQFYRKANTQTINSLTRTHTNINSEWTIRIGLDVSLYLSVCYAAPRGSFISYLLWVIRLFRLLKSFGAWLPFFNCTNDNNHASFSTGIGFPTNFTFDICDFDKTLHNNHVHTHHGCAGTRMKCTGGRVNVLIFTFQIHI